MTEPRWDGDGIARPGRPEDLDDPASAISTGDGLSFKGGLEVIATQKVKFYVDREGIIQREEFAPRKWKRKP